MPIGDHDSVYEGVGLCTPLQITLLPTVLLTRALQVHHLVCLTSLVRNVPMKRKRKLRVRGAMAGARGCWEPGSAFSPVIRLSHLGMLTACVSPVPCHPPYFPILQYVQSN